MADLPRVPGTSLNSIPATTPDDSGMLPQQPQTDPLWWLKAPWWLSALNPVGSAQAGELNPAGFPTSAIAAANAATPGTTNPLNTAAAGLNSSLPVGGVKPTLPLPSTGSGYGGMPPAAWGGTDVPQPPIKPVSLRGNGKTKPAPLQVLTPVDRAGMYALGGQTQAIGAGRNPLAYDPYYQGFRT